MSGKRDTGKTIGEVEKITGIPKRQLKYFIERNLVQPSQKSESGYWLYGEADIQRVQLAALCRDLEFPGRSIRMILADPAHHWQRELERQIARLTERRSQAEMRLILAESLSHNWSEEPWAGLVTDAVPTEK